MSLFRLAIVLSLGIAVMPSDEAQQRRLYDNASAAAHWTATFCERNTTTCVTTVTVFDTFLRKAQFAGQLLYDVAVHYVAPGDGEAAVAPASFEQSQLERGTLNPDDLEPAWRGAAAGQGA